MQILLPLICCLAAFIFSFLFLLESPMHHSNSIYVSSWLNDSGMSDDLLYLRKPSWPPINSIYVVGASTDNGIYILDFYPDSSSPSHVDYKDDAQNRSGVKKQDKKNRFLPLSERVTACAVHPLNSTIIAGTRNSSLLVISQSHKSC